MKTRLTILSIIFTFLSFQVLADEVYTLLVSDSKSSVYRSSTDNEYMDPIGYFFDCNWSYEFHIDNLKNFRLYSISSNNNFSPTSRKLARQVFDGKAYTSNFGFKTQLLEDQREQIIHDSKSKAVYRPKGGFCSIGTGKELSLHDVPILDKEQQNILHKGNKWYQINNGSWFQTWNTINCENKQNKTHLVFYEREENKQNNLIEEFWRGERPTKASSKDIGLLKSYKLLRAKVSGALNVIDGDIKLNTVWQKQDLFALCLFPDNIRSNKYSTYFYKWLGSESGHIYKNGKIENIKPIIESRNNKHRALGIAFDSSGNKKSYIIGTDIFRNWLQMLRPYVYSKNINADAIKFGLIPDAIGINVYIYSNEVSKIFKFFVKNDKASLVKEFILPRKILDFCVSNNENIYYATLDDSREKKLEIRTFSEESYKLMPAVTTDFKDEIIASNQTFTEIENVSGQIVFSQSYYVNIYKLDITNYTSEEIHSIFLHKKYYSQNFTTSTTTTEIFSVPGVNFLDFLQKSKATFSQMANNAEGFPNKYHKPKIVKLAVFHTKK